MRKPTDLIDACACCGHKYFQQETVLWRSLITEWELTAEEVSQIDRQQGYRCLKCGANLRSMALAFAIMRCFGQSGQFDVFVRKRSFRSIRLLEVNGAGDISQYLSTCRHRTLVSYPDVDIMSLPFASGTFDLVVHSDTLEHVENPISALMECNRVLKPGGYCAFTVPIVVGRMTRSRAGMPPSHHGIEQARPHDYLVHTEYGVDAWRHLVLAGFEDTRVYCLEDKTAYALVGAKAESRRKLPSLGSTHIAQFLSRFHR